MKIEEIKEKIEIAKQSVDGLEEPFKTEGFKTILAKLMEDNKLKENIQKINIATDKKNVDKKENMYSINRTNYPEIYKFKKVLERALFILKICQDDKNIDGLYSKEISNILTEIFKIKTTPEAVSMALMNAKEEADRIPEKSEKGIRVYRYKLMSRGEDLIKNILKNEH